VWSRRDERQEEKFIKIFGMLIIIVGVSLNFFLNDFNDLIFICSRRTIKLIATTTPRRSFIRVSLSDSGMDVSACVLNGIGNKLESSPCRSGRIVC
jgi:hypothetical protein